MSTPAVNTPHNQHRIKLVKNHNHVRNGKMSYGHALRKFNIKPSLPVGFDMVDELVHGESSQPLQKLQQRIQGRPATVANRRLVTKDEQGKVGKVEATDVQNDSEYIADVGIGTPTQVLQLDFVWSTELPSQIQKAGSSANHHIYDQARSSTSKALPGESWNITYGDGSSASGNICTDLVDLGGLQVHNQAIEMASKLSPAFQKGKGDGLMGLAWGSINTAQPTQVKTPMENLIAQSAIQPSAELFTAYLGSYKDVNDPDKGQSFYTFGFIDRDVLKSCGTGECNIHYTPIDNSNGFWQFPSTSYAINGEVQKMEGTTAIADTGTTLALVQDTVVKNIYAQIPGSKMSSTYGGYIFPTNTPKGKLPLVAFDVGGKLFTISKEDLSYVDIGNGMCYGGIQSVGDLDFNILGDVFLKNTYAIFDVGRKRFGCVQRIEPTNLNADDA